MGKWPSLLLVALGLLVAVVAGQASWQVGFSLRGMGDAARPTTVKDAPAGTWVRLEDATLRCATRREAGKASYYDAASKDGETFLVQALGERPCEELVLEGGFLDGRYSADWVRQRLKTEPPAGTGVDFRVFSQMLSPGFLRQALYMSLPMLVLGLVMTFFGFRAYRKAARAP